MIHLFWEPLFVSLGVIGITLGFAGVVRLTGWHGPLDTFFDIFEQSFKSCYLTFPVYFLITYKTLKILFYQLGICFTIMNLLFLFVVFIHYLYESRQWGKDD
jgi:hypothetical protein